MTQRKHSYGSDVEIVNIDAELIGSNKKNLFSLKKNTNYKYIKSNINNRKIMSVKDDILNSALTLFRFLIPMFKI